MESNYIQYGCGFSSPMGFRNFDASPTLRLERLPGLGKFIAKYTIGFPINVEYGDICSGLPLREESCMGVYCSHVLEHLSYQDCLLALHNTYDLMQKGATFRLVLPDLEHSARKYIENSSQFASLEFMKETDLGQEVRNRGFKNFVRSWLGNSSHLWMWDFNAMRNELLKVGFKEIRRASFNDSLDKMFLEVEESERWKDSLGIECIK